MLGNKTEEKKVVRKNVALGIAVVCIILVASLVGTVFSFNSTASSKDSTISSLGGQVDSLNSQISILQNRVSLDNSTMENLNSQIANLQGQIQNLQTQISNTQSQSNSTNSQNSNLQSQLNSLNSRYAALNTEYANLQNDYLGMMGVKNGTYLAYYDGIAVLNYSYSMAMNGLTRQYSAVMGIFNFESSCSIVLKLYSPTQGTSTVFSYTMPSGYRLFVETWETGWSTAYYENITIQSVQR